MKLGQIAKSAGVFVVLAVMTLVTFAVRANEEDRMAEVRVRVGGLKRQQFAAQIEKWKQAYAEPTGKSDGEVLRDLQIFVHANASFDQETAKSVVALLESQPMKADRHDRLLLFAAAKAGQLDQARIARAMKRSNDNSLGLAHRVSLASGLADAMDAVALKPKVADLMTLLKSPLVELRLVAVDWFRLSPPAEIAARANFLKVAMLVKPKQVRERAYLTVLSWSDADVAALAKHLPTVKCAREPASEVKSACESLASRMTKKAGP